MDEFTKSVSIIISHLTALNVGEVTKSLDGSAHYKAFFADPECHFMAFVQTKSADAQCQLQVVDSLLVLGDETEKVENCIGFFKKQNAGASIKSLSTSTNDPEGSPNSPSGPAPRFVPSGPLTLKDIHFQTIPVDMSDVSSQLFLQLMEVYDPMCRISSKTSSSSLLTQIDELARTIKSQESVLPDFKISQYIHPEVQALCKAHPDQSMDQLMETFTARAQDSKLLTEVQALRNKCMSEIDVDLLSHEVRSIREEISMWEHFTGWIEDTHKQLQTREWQFTTTKLLVRRIGHTTDKLPHLQQTVNETINFLQEIPFAAVLSAPNEVKMAANVKKLFDKLSDVTKKSQGYKSRALELGNSLVVEIASKIADICKEKNLFSLSPADVMEWVNGINDIIHETENDIRSLESACKAQIYQSHAGGRETRKAMVQADTKALKLLLRRVDHVQKFIENHYSFYNSVSTFPIPEIRTVSGELEEAFLRVADAAVSIWELGSRTDVQYKEIIIAYETAVSVVEDRIATIFSERLESAKTSTEMFHVYELSTPLRQRPKINSATSEYRTNILKSVDEKISETKARFFERTTKVEATRLCIARGLSSCLASITFDLAVQRQLDDQLRRRDLVSELGYHDLLQLRASDKRWQLDERLATFFGVSMEALNSGATDKRTPLSYYGTAYAIAFLHLIYAHAEQWWAPYALEARKSLGEKADDLIAAASEKLQQVGVGPRHVMQQQTATEYAKLRRKISEDIQESVGQWLKSIRACMNFSKGFREARNFGKMFVIEGLHSGKQPYLHVNFPTELDQLLNDYKELKAINVLPKEGIEDVNSFVQQCDRIHHPAMSLMEVMQTYYAALRVVGHDILLLENSNQEVSNQLKAVIHSPWDPAKTPLHVRSLCNVIQLFCSQMHEVTQITSTIHDLLELLKRCRPRELNSLMMEIQNKIVDLAGKSPSHLEHWFEGLSHRVDKILTRHIVNIIKHWQDEFVLLDRKERERAQQLTDEGVEARNLHRAFNMEPFRVTIRVLQGEIRLEPSLLVCRRHWLYRFNEALEMVVGLSPLRCDNKLRTNSPGYLVLVDSISQGLLTGALQLVENILAKVEKYVSQWETHQTLWEMELQTIMTRLGTDLVPWIQLVEEVRGNARRMMDTTEKRIDFGAMVVDQEEAQKSIAEKYRLMSDELFEQFKTMVVKKAVSEFYAEVSTTRERLDRLSVEHSIQHAIDFLCWLTELKSNIKLWSVQVANFTKGQSLLDSQKFVEYPKNWIPISLQYCCIFPT